MSELPSWLTTLQRVREHRRDAAWQSLAERLQTATHVRDATSRVVQAISQLRDTQQQNSQAGRLDFERLRQLRRDRDEWQTQLTQLQQEQSHADTAVRQAQSLAADKESEVEVLQRLSDRLLTSQLQARRRIDEQSTLESALSLCNGRLGD